MNELADNINRSMKQVTILFTDIENSTEFWDRFGDVEGRLMLDRHNRLCFPVINKFNGRVVKTIGDSIMASFKKPDDAIKAAIGIQQVLEKIRKQDKRFVTHVRIGIHTGMAIVEENDIYGDMVNVASRVESFGKGDEILISSSTVELLNPKNHSFHKKGSFTPKGKREVLTVYRCRWNEYRSMMRGLKVSSRFPIAAKEKGDIIAYASSIIFTAVILYQYYFRYLSVDYQLNAQSNFSTLINLNPLMLFDRYPFLSSLSIVLGLIIILWLIKIKHASFLAMKIMRGGFGFVCGFLLLFLPMQYMGVNQSVEPGDVVYKSPYAYVEIKNNNTSLFASDSVHSPIIEILRADTQLPLIQPDEVTGWGKVILSNEEYAWIQKQDYRGVWEVSGNAYPAQFSIQILDVCIFMLGLFGFIWGIVNFSIKPF